MDEAIEKMSTDEFLKYLQTTIGPDVELHSRKYEIFYIPGNEKVTGAYVGRESAYGILQMMTKGRMDKTKFQYPKTKDGVTVFPGMKVYDGHRELEVFAIDKDGMLMFQTPSTFRYSFYVAEAYTSMPASTPAPTPALEPRGPSPLAEFVSNALRFSKEDYEEIKRLELNSGHDLSGRWNELSICARCGGGEGGLPTHCPGVPLKHGVIDLVYNGDIDFRNGVWCNQPTTHMAHAYGLHREPFVELDLDEYLKLKGLL